MRRGFTLVEIAVGLGLLALLAALALPSLMGPIRKARRADAFDLLTLAQQAQERHRSTHSGFASSLDLLGLGEHSRAGHYRLAIDAAGASAYGMTAHAQGRQVDDIDCVSLSVRVERGRLIRSARARDGSDRSASCWPQ